MVNGRPPLGVRGPPARRGPRTRGVRPPGRGDREEARPSSGPTPSEAYLNPRGSTAGRPCRSATTARGSGTLTWVRRQPPHMDEDLSVERPRPRRRRRRRQRQEREPSRRRPTRRRRRGRKARPRPRLEPTRTRGARWRGPFQRANHDLPRAHASENPAAAPRTGQPRRPLPPRRAKHQSLARGPGP